MHLQQPLQVKGLLDEFTNTRNKSLSICEPLSDEDLQAQSMPDASPLKWHLAHTSWAFETFILKPFYNNYLAFDPIYEYLFNSYYNAIGEQFPRAQRGQLTRPNRASVIEYRTIIDEMMSDFILNLLNKNNTSLSADNYAKVINLIQLMINHEQQHQELMLTDLKHLFSLNPGHPVYQDIEQFKTCQPAEPIEFNEGIYNIGHNHESFYFDNEGPQHPHWLAAFKLDPMLVSNKDYLEFVENDGYVNPAYWLSEAWQKINLSNLRHPAYWVKIGSKWFEHSLNGLIPLERDKPAKHLSYFEANAYANWKGKRLPTEQEWEVAARSNNPLLKQMFDQLWQWTSSSYSAYPGFKAANGAIGEYNGKFMVNQYVLRGGSIVTPAGHLRPSYRNFFYPDAYWQFSGIRLAE